MAADLVPMTEDGTMPPGANCYVALAEAESLILGRGLADWPAPPVQPGPPDPPAPDPEGGRKAAALIRGADYLNGLHWYGRRAAAGRMMAWPRLGAVDKDGYAVPEGAVPDAVPLANAYAAWLVYTGADTQPIMERGNRASAKGVDTITASYFGDAPSRDVYAFLADLLYPYCSDFDAFAGTALPGAGGVAVAEGVI
ncbi:MAG: hypothetical protein LBG06_10160 [Deltaproteobacteria bacterium]|jgi:hypothetical protein|nr:hypothetical protein [Deltaproteobacteria bacterium]